MVDFPQKGFPTLFYRASTFTQEGYFSCLWYFMYCCKEETEQSLALQAVWPSEEGVCVGSLARLIGSLVFRLNIRYLVLFLSWYYNSSSPVSKLEARATICPRLLLDEGRGVAQSPHSVHRNLPLWQLNSSSAVLMDSLFHCGPCGKHWWTIFTVAPATFASWGRCLDSLNGKPPPPKSGGKGFLGTVF